MIRLDPRHRSRWLRAGTVLSAAVAVLLANATSVGADAPTYAGWWTTANPGVSGSSVPTFVPAGGGPDGGPSDVPPGGLEVSGLPEDRSIAAIGYSGQGSTVEKVVLHEDPNAVSAPGSQVEACPLAGSGVFRPAYGAPTSEEPKYDCGSHEPGVIDASAGTVTFAVSGFVHDDYLGVAIVAVGTGRMVFDAPGKDTIVVAPGPGASPLSGATPVPADDSGAGGSALASGGAGTASPISSAAGQPAPALATGTSGSGPGNAAGPASGAAGSGPAAGPTMSAAPAARNASVLVTEPIKTIGTGGAVVGFLVLLAGAALTSRRNRRLMSSSNDQ